MMPLTRFKHFLLDIVSVALAKLVATMFERLMFPDGCQGMALWVPMCCEWLFTGYFVVARVLLCGF